MTRTWRRWTAGTKRTAKETKKLFPLSDAERIDRFLTFVMHECGVTVNGLSIGQTMQYYIDGEGNLVTASPDDVANSSGSDSSGSETDGSTALIHQRVSIAVTLRIPWKAVTAT